MNPRGFLAILVLVGCTRAKTTMSSQVAAPRAVVHPSAPIAPTP